MMKMNLPEYVVVNLVCIWTSLDIFPAEKLHLSNLNLCSRSEAIQTLRKI